MAGSTQTRKDYEWEKEFAPRVTRRHLTLVVTVYCAWIALLAVLAMNCWGVLD